MQRKGQIQVYQACFLAQTVHSSLQNMLHPDLVFKTIFHRSANSGKSLLKTILGRPSNPTFPVLAGDSDKAFQRHIRICETLYNEIKRLKIKMSGAACEIGCGDCLASADLLLGGGYKKIYLIEKNMSHKIHEKQQNILKKLAKMPELPNSLKIFSHSGSGEIDEGRAVLIREHLEKASLPEPVDFLFSHDVLEHVEDLDGFFRACLKILKPGGMMIHKFDLTGHGLLEDPIPPLDFQTYPEWLYALMYPKYSRATRQLLSVYIHQVQKKGFEDIRVECLRKASAEYIDSIWPSLRAAVRLEPKDSLAQLELILSARKKSE
jgi:SAM-dependent methyltransferase